MEREKAVHDIELGRKTLYRERRSLLTDVGTHTSENRKRNCVQVGL